MKNLLMGLAVCALIMTSCTKNDVIENITEGQGQLSFSPGVGKQATTRVAELNNTALQGKVGTNGIVLNAYQNVSSAWSKWYTDKVVWNKNSSGKWELDGSVRFRNVNATKYLSYFSEKGLVTNPTNFDNATFVTTTGVFPKFTYTVAATSDVQEDLIAGITEIDANKSDITLGMRHILSQVNFGTVGYKGAKIQIQNIKIAGVGSSADFTYRAANTYPIGDWSDPAATATGYDYYNWSNAAAGVVHTLVPATATSGDKYIFGDGGNAGPGRNINTWYPNSASGVWNPAPPAGGNGLRNSLMLLPQTLVDGAKVTFEYKIQDVDNAYVAGNASTWAQGEFSLNFSTGTTTGSHYNSKWEQNYRYVYLIDFTDFLDGVALTFKVDVDMYEWENYNKDVVGGDDGIVDVMAAGQPSQKNMNDATFTNGNTWYIASQSETSPTDASYTQAKWAQVMRNETWDLSAYDFMNIDASETFVFNFQNVIFNTDKASAGAATTITMTLPTGYTAALKAGSTATNLTIDDTNAPTYVISAGDGSDKAAINITNNSVYNSASSLRTGIAAITTDAKTIYYKGTEAINLVSMNNTKTELVAGNTIVVEFTSLVIPIAGEAKTLQNNIITGLWTWDATNKTATWTSKITWNNLGDTKIAIGTALANDKIYCSDATSNLNLVTAFGEPATATNSPVTVVFNNSAIRNGGATTYGYWSFSNITQTATWTLSWKNLVNAQTAFAAAAAGGFVYCNNATITDVSTSFDEPTDASTMAQNDVVIIVFQTADSNRLVGAATTNGVWATTDNITYTWTRN